MAPSMAVCTLLTDFGRRDYYVAAVRGTLLRLAPGTQVVDLSHEVEPGDVEGGAFLLGAAAGCFPAGTVHCAVVDPGVGSDRRILVAETGGAAFVAPDNGLLTPVLEGARVRTVESEDHFLAAPGETFHGRDRFAPTAAWLLRGEPAGRLGPTIDDAVRLDIPAPHREDDGTLVGRIAHIDRFGNLVSDIPAAWLERRPFEARIGGGRVTRTAVTYSDLPVGSPGLIVGSLGTLEFSLRDASLAARFGSRRGETVRVEFR